MERETFSHSSCTIIQIHRLFVKAIRIFFLESLFSLEVSDTNLFTHFHTYILSFPRLFVKSFIRFICGDLWGDV